jgi:protein TonB
MFETLLESKRKKQRSAGGAFFSFVVHTVAIGLAVVATANAGMKTLDNDTQEEVKFVKVEKEPPPPEKPPPPPDAVVAPPPPKGFQILAAPVVIPNVLPDIDLSKKMTDEADFSGKGVAGGTSTGVVGGVPKPITTDATYYEFQVEKQAAVAPNNPAPDYPEMLKQAMVQGEVQVQFVIDTTGRADMSTLKILKSTHDQFTKAVRDVLPKMRFLPAEVGGRKVKQFVQLPFTFNIK